MSFLQKAFDVETGAAPGTRPGLPAIPPGAQTVQIDPRDVSFLAVARDYIDTVTGASYFGPGQPLKPQAPPGTLPVVTDYAMTINMNAQPRTEQGTGPQFGLLRSFASTGILRLCINRRKRQIVKIPLTWKVDKLPGEKSREHDKRSASDPRVQYLTNFFKRPDQENDFMPWFSMLLEEVLVTDALAIWPVMDDGRVTKSLRILDGDFIKPLWDAQGWRPNAPNPGYQQFRKGMPSVNMTAGECQQCLTRGYHTITLNGRTQNGSCTPLIYSMQNPRAKELYGLSPVQSCLDYAVMSVNRLVSQTAYFTEGNTPEMIIAVPEGWTVEQIARFQDIFDQSAGNLYKRRRVKFIPFAGAGAVTQTKDAMLKDDLDEWIARVFCDALSISPTPYIRQLNRSSSQTNQESAREEGTLGDLEAFESLFTRLANEGMKVTGVSAHFDLESDPDPEVQARIIDIGLKNGSKQINEVREDAGDDPIPGLPPGIVTAQGFQPFQAMIDQANGAAQTALNPSAPVQPGQKQIGSRGGTGGGGGGNDESNATIKLLLEGPAPARLKKKVLELNY